MPADRFEFGCVKRQEVFVQGRSGQCHRVEKGGFIRYEPCQHHSMDYGREGLLDTIKALEVPRDQACRGGIRPEGCIGTGIIM